MPTSKAGASFPLGGNLYVESLAIQQCLPLTNGSSLTQSLQGTGIALRPTFIKLAFAANRAVPPGNRRQNLSDCANRKQHILATMHKFCAIIALQEKALSGHLKAP